MRCIRDGVTLITASIALIVTGAFLLHQSLAADWRWCTLPWLGGERALWPWLPRRTPQLRGFQVSIGWACPQCYLVQDIRAWDGRTMVRSKNAVHRQGRASGHDKACVAQALGPGQPPAERGALSLILHNASREARYRRWAQRLGLAPMDASLTMVGGGRPIGAVLWQRGGCPSVQQQSPWHCPVIERCEAHVNGIRVMADKACKTGNKLPLHVASLPILLAVESIEGQVDVNPYHALFVSERTFSLWCIWEAVRDLRRLHIGEVHLAMPSAALRAMSSFEVAILRSLAPMANFFPGSNEQNTSYATFARIFTPDRPGIQRLERRSFVNYMRSFLVDRAAEPRLMHFAADVRLAVLGRHAATVAGPTTTPAHVLLVQRTRTRILGGANTGQLAEVVQAMCVRGLAVRVASFDSVPLVEQMRATTAATVLLSVHGSQMVNIIWMHPERAAVVEVLLRYGWCCGNDDHGTGIGVVSGSMLDPAEPRCPHGCNGYYKSDIANLASAFGIRYVYLDALYISPPQHSNPIERRHVLVNATEAALLADLLMNDELRYG